MKIEKLNDHQIRCTLTKEDLAARHIKLSELAYGTEKTRALFQDMMTQASMDFGFEADDIPLMVEAIPLSSEKIVLIITKVESPEELDTRFSEFTHFSDESEDYGEAETESEDSDMDIPEELTDLLHQLKREIADSVAGNTPDTKNDDLPANLVCLFSFTDIEVGIRASHAIAPFYRGESSLYRDPHSNEYLLFLHQGAHNAREFSRIVLTMNAYLEKKKCIPATEGYCREHSQIIVLKKAVSTLAQI